MQSLSTNGHQATMTIPSAMVTPNPPDREEEKERNGSLNQALLADKRFSHN